METHQASATKTQVQITPTHLNQGGAVVDPSPSLRRREFLSRLGGVTAATFALSHSSWPARLQTAHATTAGKSEACDIGSDTGRRRLEQAYEVRLKAALYQRKLPLPPHPCNGDEALYATKIGSYSKGLPHHENGEVDLPSYEALIHALSTGRPADFEAIPLGGSFKLINPQAAYAFSLEGLDSHHLGMVAPPAFESAEIASEMAELYWQALTRDVPFAEYETSSHTAAAADDLSRFSAFRGPKVSGAVTPATLFRGATSGNLTGPYLSQFLWHDISFGAMKIPQKYHVPVAGDDHVTTYADWLDLQRGLLPTQTTTLDRMPHYLSNGRELAEYVHLNFTSFPARTDFAYQASINACLILLEWGEDALDVGNPYVHTTTQAGFITFGAAGILDPGEPGHHCSLKSSLVSEVVSASPPTA